MRIGTLTWMGSLLAGVGPLLVGCGESGHVVADMASDGTGGATPGGNPVGSGGTSASGAGATTTPPSSSTTTATTGSGGESGGVASVGMGVGGSAGDAATGSGGSSSGGGGGTAGAGGTCPSGQTWCPGCYEGEGMCAAGCPGSQCGDCSLEQSEEDCEARVDCHPVYVDLGMCGCGTPGCCAQFSFCATGATADCEGLDLACLSQSPFCEGPAFVSSYADACYEGCVKPEHCAAGAGVCPCADCAEGESQCLEAEADECVMATGPVGNGLCRNSDGTCGMCRCASPDTPIATPTGNRAIRELRVGDYVYSVQGASIELVPIKQINRTLAMNHHVLRFEFESGAKFEMSALHPTASGRALSALEVGDELMGQRIVRVTRIPYEHSHTYDILPDSDTGTYFADGVLVGSTLHQQ